VNGLRAFITSRDVESALPGGLLWLAALPNSDGRTLYLRIGIR